MHFVQKALLTDRTEFEFGEKNLSFSYEGETKKVRFDVPYASINTQKTLKSFSMLGMARLGRTIVLGAFTGYAMVYAIHYSLYKTSVDDTIFFCFLVMGLALRILGGKYAKFDATLIPVGQKNNIIIIRDAQHNAILEEITRRRVSDLRRIHAQVDALNHPEFELKKFIWLKGEGIISEEEYAVARQKIAAENPKIAAVLF